MDILVGNKKYDVEVAENEEERMKGLQEVIEMDDDEGMLFIFPEPQHVDFWMKDTEIPLDIIFINSDLEVISVKQGEPMSEDFISEDNVQYVLEVNQNSGIEEGDDVILDYEEDDEEDEAAKMYVLGSDGQAQYELVGGERIFSRPNTKVLVSKAKKAYKTKSDSDYKALGRQVFKYLEKQNSNEPEYVESPN